MSFEKRFFKDFKFRVWNGKEINNNWQIVTNNDVILQATGFFDKHGEEIYEGDIITFSDYCSDKFMLRGEREKCVVKWYKNRASFHPSDLEKNHHGEHYLHFWEQIEDIEIIGCIFENNENDPKKFFEYDR